MVLATALVGISFVACGDDEEKDGGITLSDIDVIGTWSTPLGEYPVNFDGDKTAKGKWSWKFGTDRTYYGNFYGDNGYTLRSYKGVYTIAGNTVTGKSGNVTETFKFLSLNGNNATVEYKVGDNTYTMQITKSIEPENMLTGTWLGEFQEKGNGMAYPEGDPRADEYYTWIRLLTMKADYTGSYSEYVKDGNIGEPHGFSYKTYKKEGNDILSIKWNERLEDGDSLLLQYAVIENQLKLKEVGGTSRIHFQDGLPSFGAIPIYLTKQQ